MKVMAISTPTDVDDVLARAESAGYKVFVYKHADPYRRLGLHSFYYIGSDEELFEKIQLLRRDSIIKYELELGNMEDEHD